MNRDSLGGGSSSGSSQAAMRTGPRWTYLTQQRAWFANPSERPAQVEQAALTQVASSTRHPNAIALVHNVAIARQVHAAPDDKL